MNMTFGPPLKASEVTETGWYYIDRPGPPRGYVYISSDPDDVLYFNHLNGVFPLNERLIGTFYKVPDRPFEQDDAPEEL
jgi:hypothetical protein